MSRTCLWEKKLLGAFPHENIERFPNHSSQLNISTVEPPRTHVQFNCTELNFTLEGHSLPSQPPCWLVVQSWIPVPVKKKKCEKYQCTLPLRATHSSMLVGGAVVDPCACEEEEIAKRSMHFALEGHSLPSQPQCWLVVQSWIPVPVKKKCEKDQCTLPLRATGFLLNLHVGWWCSRGSLCL